MYLKRLDLQGFKSFPEKVKLEFNKGITAVVGPNGSGKSNISDSVRWVLGEQSAKSLRGGKMEDVIFAGPQNRKPLGFAEVSITIDNEDKKMPIEFSEVTVTRRVYRSGESDYLINKTPCRLKDVHELFMDTGVGREGYSIIGQGKIDEILSSKSDDRRRLFEEAAGIVKYKIRREESEQKLEKEHQSLVRVEDIILELSSQLEPLKIESEKAKKYISLSEKLKDIDIKLFKIRIDKIENDIKNIEDSINILKSDAEAEEKNGVCLKEKSSELKLEYEKLTENIQLLNDEITSIAVDIEKNESSLALSKEQIQHFDENIKRLNDENIQNNQKIDELQNEINVLNSKKTATELNMFEENKRLENLTNEFNKINSSMSQSEEHLEKYKSEMIEKIKITTDVKGKISSIETLLEQLDSRQKQISDEIDYIKSKKTDGEAHCLAVNEKLKNIDIEFNEIKSVKEKLEAQKNTISENIKNTSESLNSKRNHYAELKSRYDILSEMEKEHEGFSKSVKSVLKLKEKGGEHFSGIKGALGELIKVGKEYETAIETALGGAIQNIVTNTDDDARKAIEYLKKNNLGRATFLPISSVKGRDNNIDKQKIKNEAGVINMAMDLVEYPIEYTGIISNLLGRIIVTDNIKNAMSLAKKLNYSYKIVTVEGDVMNAGGSMTGGSIAKKNSGVFGRSREIKELSNELSKISDEGGKLSNELAKYNKELEETAESISEASEERQKLEIEKAAAYDDKKRTENEIEQFSEQIQNMSNELNSVYQKNEASQNELKELINKLESIEADIKSMDNNLTQYQTSLQSEKTGKDEILEGITSAKINVSSLEQQKNSIDENIERTTNNIASIKNRLVEAKNEIELLNDKKQQKLLELQDISENIENKKAVQSQKQSVLSEITSNRSEIDKQRSQNDENILVSADRLSKLKNDMFRAETKMEKAFEEKQRLFQDMWEQYEITYKDAIEHASDESSASDLSRKSKELRAEIRQLGSVDTGAVERYKEVSERHAFLTSQRDDIIETEKKLKSIIEDLTMLMEKQFKEQFVIISENFNVVFKEMFGGGKAYLKLADEGSVLESGIDIIAQPPGKNLQNMMLLSGGERALTAIAILFSILKMKPSPFCILDEIEAALDDANVRRYANYLKNFSSDTQFIVITHRKGTMEAADVMYGVTMQEQGISKLVSVKFDEKSA